MTPTLIDELLTLEDRVAVVTGAGQGIGRAIAERLAHAGARVVVHYRSSSEAAGALARSLPRAIALRADLTREEDVTALFERVQRELGAVHVLVNNAGAYPVHPLLDVEADAWRRVVDDNLTTTHLCTQEAARRMRGDGGDRAIVNVASVEAWRTAPGHSHYNAAKAAVVHYTRSCALELGEYGIRVNSVSPGLIDREGLEEAWPEGVRAYESRSPLGRIGKAEEVANAVLFLASPAAAWITGTDLVVDGGVLSAPLL